MFLSQSSALSTTSHELPFTRACRQVDRQVDRRVDVQVGARTTPR